MLWKSLSFTATALAISLSLAAAPAKAADGDVTRDSQAKSRYELHHRVLLPLPGRESTSKFSRRGSIDILTSNAGLPEGIVPSVSITEQGSSPLPLPTAEDEVDWNRVFEKSWYQLALELPDVDEDLWPKLVVKLCHLFTSSPVSDVLTVYIPAVSDVKDVIPESIFYSVASAPTNGACPRGKKVDVRSRRDLEALLSGLQSTWNTSVKVASTEQVVLPSLQPPPALRIDPNTNQPIPPSAADQPPPEKTFLQKYWMYIFGAFMVLSLLMGGDEPARGGAGAARPAPVKR